MVCARPDETARPEDPARPEEPARPGGTARGHGGNGARRHLLDTERLLAAEEAATKVVTPITELWRSLVNAADAATTPLTLDSLLRDSLSTMAQVLSVSSVAVLLANEEGDELVLRTAVGLEEELTPHLGIRAGQGMSGTVLATRQPLVVDDLSTIEVVNPVLRDSGLRSVVAVPLLADQRALGVMYAASYERARFTRSDAQLLQVVADRLAAALDRVRLFEEERAARQEAERLAARLTRLQHVTTLLARADTVASVAKVLVHDRPEASEARRSARAVWLIDDHELVRAARAGHLQPPWAERVPLDADHPLALACRQRRLLVEPGTDGADGAAGRRWCILPITGHRQCLGVLAVMTEGAQLPDEERRTLATILDQAAQALDRARLAAARRQAAEEAQFFASAARALAEADTLEETIDRLGALAVGVLGDICLIDILDEDANLVRLVARHRDPARQHLVDRLRFEFPPSPSGPHPAVAAIRLGRSSWAGTMSDAYLRATTVSDEHFELVKQLGFRSYVTVPIAAGGRALGSVTSVSTSRPFGRADLEFAGRLASQVAAVVDNARRYESAFHTSHVLQSTLLPAEIPHVEGVAVETRYLTANRGLEVGGDFFDVLRLPSGLLLVMIGDVAGHDRQAAAQMGHLRSAARALAAQVSSPGMLLDTLRSSWDLLAFTRFATMLVGTVDLRDGSTTFASAGHYPPLLATARDASYLPVEPSPPLGMPATAASEWHGHVPAGAVVLAYTDGVIDERGAGTVASMAQMAQVAVAGELSPVAVCERVVAALPHDRGDDAALLAFGMVGDPVAEPATRPGGGAHGSPGACDAPTRGKIWQPR